MFQIFFFFFFFFFVLVLSFLVHFMLYPLRKSLEMHGKSTLMFNHQVNLVSDVVIVDAFREVSMSFRKKFCS